MKSAYFVSIKMPFNAKRKVVSNFTVVFPVNCTHFFQTVTVGRHELASTIESELRNKVQESALAA